jgi:putative ABC transport system permease protein
MNVLTRGMRNALRSPLRSVSVMVMLAISICLILAMMVARSSVNAKIDEVKASVATKVSISPAGVSGGFGGGDPLTADQLQKIKATAHVASVISTLTDQLSTDNTSLTPSFELGSIGKRFAGGSSSGGSPTIMFRSADGKESGEAPKPRTVITGTSDPSAVIASSKLTSGAMIDGNSSDNIALVGKTLADKNNLKPGDTFTAYDKKITVKGIYKSDNQFENNGLIMPIATVQNLTSQKGEATAVTVTVDSSDNVSSTVAALKKTLGDKADITSQEDQAKESLAPLESIAGLATAGVIGASIAGSVIILLSMIMVVRERRREIGVIKAIGGTNAKVIVQFVTEALTLTVIGAVLGLGLGILTSGPLTKSLVANSDSNTTNQGGPSNSISRGTNGPVMIRDGGLRGIGNQLGANVKDVTSTLTPTIMLESVGIILLIAIIGSAVPAWAIAHVRPAEVLRTE